MKYFPNINSTIDAMNSHFGYFKLVVGKSVYECPNLEKECKQISGDMKSYFKIESKPCKKTKKDLPKKKSSKWITWVLIGTISGLVLALLAASALVLCYMYYFKKKTPQRKIKILSKGYPESAIVTSLRSPPNSG